MNPKVIITGQLSDFSMRRNNWLLMFNIRSAYISMIFLFLLATIFDPADKVLGLKIPLYVACWGVAIAMLLMRQEEIKVHFKLFVYILLMTGIPVTSIVYYYLINGSDPFKGFELLKGYIFISFAMLIYITKIDILKYLCPVLTMLAISILVLTAVVLIFPELFMPLYMLGGELGMFNIDSGRDYGEGVVLFQMYFVTSPMLVIAVAYYFKLAKTSKKHQLLFVVITLLNICALLVAGTRNNILAAIILPLALVILYSRKKIHTAMWIVVLSGLFVFIMQNEIEALFDPTEASNSSKLILLRDYVSILSDPIKLIFGSGLGAFDQWTEKGFTYITELTYLEIIRNFGIILGGGMILLLVYPIIYTFVLHRSYNEKNIILGYLSYLVMCIANPNLFSSMGIMFLGVIMANICMYETDRRRHLSMMAKMNPHSDGVLLASGVHDYKLKIDIR